MNLKFPELDQEIWHTSKSWRMSQQFFFHEQNDPVRMLLAARAMIVLLGMVLGLLIYFWSRSFFGPGGGLLSLALYAFSPTFLAHGRVVTSDIALALFLSLSLWSVSAA